MSPAATIPERQKMESHHGPATIVCSHLLLNSSRAPSSKVKTMVAHLAVFVFTIAPGEAALWESPHWALLGNVSGTGGYDSNLTLSHEGEGSGFATLEPEFVFERISSATKLEFSGKVVGTHFFDKDQDSQFEPSFSVEYEYPDWKDNLPRLTGSASWNRSTTGDASVGNRISAAYTHVNFGGRFFSTGKIGLSAEASYAGVDYQGNRFVTHQLGTISIGAGYEPNQLAEYSLNLVSSYGETAPSQLIAGRVKNWEEGLTLRVRGKLSPKVTGSIYAGAAAVKYTGSFSRSDGLPLGGGEIGWHLTPGGWIYGGLDFGADYSPDGQSLEIHRVSLRYQQTIFQAWRCEFRTSPGRTLYYRQTKLREDRIFSTGVAVIYEPSTRFLIRTGYEFTKQDSNVLFANFDRHLATTRVAYRF